MSDASDIIPDSALPQSTDAQQGGASSDVIPHSALAAPAGIKPPANQAQTGAQHLQEGINILKSHPLTFGVGMMEQGLSGFTGGLGSVADALTLHHPGEPSYAQDWAYRPRTEVGKQLASFGATEGAAQSRGYDKTFGTGNLATTIKDYGPEAVSAVSTIAGAGEGLQGGVNLVRGLRAPETIETGHPLTDAAQAESSKLEAARQAAQDYGLSLPDREVSAPQRFVNDAAISDLKLPKNAPVTGGLIDSAISKYAGPAFDAVEKTPDYELGPKYQEAIGKVDLSKVDAELRPPTSGTMNGSQALDFSRNLRNEADNWFDYADGAGGPLARKTAQAYWRASKAVEQGYREGTAATPELADNWDAARVYTAKAKTYADALDGAGNVIGPKIKRYAAAGNPVSGQMEQAASVVAQYPELFRSTRLSTPAPGILRKTAAALAPTAVGAGGTLAMGPLGTVPSILAGEYLKGRLLGK